MSAIQISHLSKSFTTQPVLNDVSLHIHHGEFVAVLGPSGCGKTTLLRTIAGFEPVNSGTIIVGERLFSSTASMSQRKSAIWALCFRTTRCGRICRWRKT